MSFGADESSQARSRLSGLMCAEASKNRWFVALAALESDAGPEA